LKTRHRREKEKKKKKGEGQEVPEGLLARPDVETSHQMRSKSRRGPGGGEEYKRGEAEKMGGTPDAQHRARTPSNLKKGSNRAHREQKKGGKGENKIFR